MLAQLGGGKLFFMVVSTFLDVDGSAHILCASLATRCQVERSLLWKTTGSLAAVGNDLRVGI